MADSDNGSDLITWEDAAGVRHFLNADIVVSFDHEVAAEVTTNAVEKGSDPADHIRVLPRKVTLEVCQSPTPIFAEDGFESTDIELEYVGVPSAIGKLLGGTAAAAAIGATVGLVPAPIADGAAIGAGAGAAAILAQTGINDRPTETMVVHVLQGTTAKDRVNDLFDALTQIVDTTRTITICQRGKRMPDYALTVAKISYGKDGLARIKLEAQQYRTVTSATTKLPDPASLRAKPNKSKSANPKDGKGKPANRSFLVQGGIKLGALDPNSPASSFSP